VELLVSILPSKVGSLLSLKSLTEDINVSHHTVERWITILDKIFQTHLGTNDYGNELKDGRVLPFPKLCQELELL
jgi:predicted AAA+ superfamily ATPase